MSDDTAHKQHLLAAHTARLRVIEQQVVRFGTAHAPAHLLTEVDDLRKQIADLEQELRRPLPSAAARRSNLPADAPTDRPFVGRADDLQRVLAHVRSGHRRCTAIYGMGGMGKTALAEATGRTLLADDTFADGVWKVDLRNIASVADARVNIVVALGLPTPAADNRALAAALGDRDALLIFDDLDALHNADNSGLRDLLSKLLELPRLRLLLTSRPRLYDPPQHAVDLLRVNDDDALALFATYNADVPDPADWPPTQRAALLAALHGYPLAIRLAATLSEREGWSLDTLLRRLRERAATVFRFPGAASDRDASLAAALDLSYDALTEDARAMFGALALFPAGLTAEAAQSIFGPTAEDTLAALRRASMAEYRAADQRTLLPEPARDYAEHKQPPDLRDRHGPVALEYYADMVERCNNLLLTGKDEEGRDALTADLLNIYAFLDWGYIHEQSENNVSRSARTTALLNSNYWMLTSMRSQDATLQRLQQALVVAQREEDRFGEANTRKAIGDVQQYRGEQEAALASYAAALDLFRTVGDRLGEANTLQAIGDVQQFRDEQEAALASYAAALDLFRTVGDRLGEANTLRAIGDVQQYRGEQEAALASYAAALDLFRTVGSRLGEANTLQAIGDVQQFRDEQEAALASYAAALDLFRTVGSRLGEANTLQAIGDVQQFRDEQEAALASYAAALDLFRTVGDRLGEANTRKAIGDVQQFRDEQEAALASYAAALDLFRTVGSRLGEANTLRAIGDVQQFRKQQEAALASYAAALDLFRTVGSRLGEANTLAALSRLQIDADPAQSQMLLAQALELRRAIGSVYDEAVDQYNYGLALLNRSRGAEALPYLENARDLFRSRQIIYLAEQAEQLIARAQAQVAADDAPPS